MTPMGDQFSPLFVVAGALLLIGARDPRVAGWGVIAITLLMRWHFIDPQPEWMKSNQAALERFLSGGYAAAPWRAPGQYLFAAAPRLAGLADFRFVWHVAITAAFAMPFAFRPGFATVSYFLFCARMFTSISLTNSGGPQELGAALTSGAIYLAITGRERSAAALAGGAASLSIPALFFAPFFLRALSLSQARAIFAAVLLGFYVPCLFANFDGARAAVSQHAWFEWCGAIAIASGLFAAGWFHPQKRTLLYCGAIAAAAAHRLNGSGFLFWDLTAFSIPFAVFALYLDSRDTSR